MANPNYNYYRYVISFVVFLIAQFVAGDDTIPLLGGKKLIIGVPKKRGFTQFVDAQMSPINKTQLDQVTGYAIDVFNATVSHLQRLGHNISFEYRAFVNESGERAGTYDELLAQIPAQKYDAVVGDVTIVAYRTNSVDFTLPFVESGVMMLVKNQPDERLNMWIFLRPFHWDLWLSISVFSIYIGCIIHFMERNVSEDARFENISPQHTNQLSAVSIFWFPLAQVFLPERESVAKKCSRFVLVMWLILACILMQSYTASLSSILTVDQLQPSYPSVNDVKKDPKIKVGFPGDSFLKGLIVERLKFDASRLKPYFTIEQYQEALDKGSDRGGVDAIIHEVPYIKFFLKHQRNSNKYAMVRTCYRLDGFGFAFPKDSNLTSYFSRAVLNVTESGEEMDLIEQKYFGSSVNGVQEELRPSSDTPSLTMRSFAGLFLIIGCLTFSALLISESCIWHEPVKLAKTFSQKYLFTSRSNKISQSRDGPTCTFESGEDIQSVVINIEMV